MTIREFCLKHIQVGELMIFKENGWIIGSTYIDHEDMFTIPETIANKEVKSNSWQRIYLTTANGDKVSAPCHVIDF